MPEIQYQKDRGVALATINRPDALNAFKASMFDDLRSIMEDVQADDTLRVLVLTGTGRAFSAGIDLKEMNRLLSGPMLLKENRDLLLTYQNMTRQMVRLPKTIIAAINGLAVGVGVELAISSDIRLAADSATFTFAEVKRGLFETNGVMYFLPRLVGYGRAAEWMITGRTVPAQEAYQTGLVTRVYPADQLLDEAMALAREVAANAPISVRLIKQVMQRSADLDLESVLQLEVDGVMEVLTSDDLREGLQAFVEKRPPVYRGK